MRHYYNQQICNNANRRWTLLIPTFVQLWLHKPIIILLFHFFSNSHVIKSWMKKREKTDGGTKYLSYGRLLSPPMTQSATLKHILQKSMRIFSRRYIHLTEITNISKNHIQTQQNKKMRIGGTGQRNKKDALDSQTNVPFVRFVWRET